MITVEQLVKDKVNQEVWSVTPHTTVIDTLHLLAEKSIGAVLVMDGERLVGVFSERDYARKGIVQGRKAKSTPVAEVMTPRVYTVSLDMNIQDCMQLMTQRKIRHLPVLDDGKVVGVLSIGDIVMAMIQEQGHHIEFLEQYITGI
ncbi:CBS domain-containing protein [Rhabdobacter roseus]|uniref:CBS domain-containing protein n=1 Tax=Rhabdobacter roseus TaxID=1655419 RepID=A0A840U0E2_9BACT|nr:CBS domain-containing protein [Rhabdobacter roseus]MBB5285349.1 CBS domain-containing protein [Rhabdobacter roseus]